MGRPLKKDVLGTNVIGEQNGSSPNNTGVRVEFWNGSSVVTAGSIIKQRGAKTFVVAATSDVAAATGGATGNIKNTANKFTRILINATPSALLPLSNPGEGMRLFGYVGSNSSSAVNIAKITKRVATDFSGNRYTWVLENDSSNDYIVLTAI
jgi:hypothetical protein